MTYVVKNHAVLLCANISPKTPFEHQTSLACIPHFVRTGTNFYLVHKKKTNKFSQRENLANGAYSDHNRKKVTHLPDFLCAQNNFALKRDLC